MTELDKREVESYFENFHVLINIVEKTLRTEKILRNDDISKETSLINNDEIECYNEEANTTCDIPEESIISMSSEISFNETFQRENDETEISLNITTYTRELEQIAKTSEMDKRYTENTTSNKEIQSLVCEMDIEKEKNFEDISDKEEERIIRKTLSDMPINNEERCVEKPLSNTPINDEDYDMVDMDISDIEEERMSENQTRQKDDEEERNKQIINNIQNGFVSQENESHTIISIEYNTVVCSTPSFQVIFKLNTLPSS